ncbi:MAG: methyltransferase domain-containing protein [Actinomycetota bacterium]|nr:methyltransferase domain-containing protein [Actinomycetota bacterium]
MTSTDTDWAAHAAGLAAALTDSGDLHDPAWAAALAATPRHLLVPVAYQQQADGSWAEFDTGGQDLELAYSPTTLVTEINDDGAAISSSTKPDLMVRMLETLDVQDGHRVLEIGTGTGYNAALLTHRLDADHVFSLDVGPELVATARQRLASIGCRPHLAAHDGIGGWPEHAPYDRIIATCSVPSIPWDWAQQLTIGGKLLADLKLGTGAGNLVLLHRYDDRLEGRFTKRWAAFMGMRHHGDVTAIHTPKAEPSTQRVTTTPAQPWNTDREVWLLSCLRLPRDLSYGYTLDPTTRTPKATTLSAPDGSWCEVELTTDDSVFRQVREGGPTPLWGQVERAYDLWRQWNQPSWERLGLTVTQDAQVVWLDEPHNIVTRSGSGGG